MSVHLSSDELIDALEAPLGHERQQHLDGCERCRAQFAELRRLAAHVRDAGDVPEPSPLFWEHFRARVHAAVDLEPARAGRRAWTGWRAVAAVAGVAVAVLLAVSVRPDLSLRRLVTGSSERAAVTAPPAAEVANGEESFEAVVSNATVEAIESVARPAPGVTDEMVAQLTPEQRLELVRLLQSEIGGSE